MLRVERKRGKETLQEPIREFSRNMQRMHASSMDRINVSRHQMMWGDRRARMTSKWTISELTISLRGRKAAVENFWLRLRRCSAVCGIRASSICSRLRPAHLKVADHCVVNRVAYLHILRYTDARAVKAPDSPLSSYEYTVSRKISMHA